MRAVSRLCEFYHGICLTTEGKARKNLSQGKKNLGKGIVDTLPKHPHITKPTHIHTITHTHTLAHTTHTHAHTHTHTYARARPHTHAHTRPHTHITKPTHYKTIFGPPLLLLISSLFSNSLIVLPWSILYPASSAVTILTHAFRIPLFKERSH